MHVMTPIPRIDHPPPEGKTGHVPADSDDELLAMLYIGTWMLRTGRVLPRDVPPHELHEEELIAFWADDRLDEEPRPFPPYGLRTGRR